MWWKMLAVVLFSALGSVLAEEEPILYVTNKHAVYDVGEKKVIGCNTTGNIDDVQWLSPSNEVVKGRSSKNNRVIVERIRDKKLLILFIQKTHTEDTGNWTCKSGEASAVTQILVGEKVHLDQKDHKYESEEGNSARLECVAKGTPTPIVQWYKEGVPITDDNVKYKIKKSGDASNLLTIRKLSHLDAGEYVCKVTQEELYHYTEKSFHLSVRHKPVLLDPNTGTAFASTARTEEVYVILNQTRNITCSSTANPSPEYRWSRKQDNSYEQPITGEDMVFTSEDGKTSVLQLNMYDESQLGQYKCSVKNSIGQASVIYDVSVGNAPERPDYVSVFSTEPHSIVFNVTCSNCTMDQEPGIAPKPDNLPAIGYSFELVKVVEGYDIPDWQAATEVTVYIADTNSTLFNVSGIDNGTTFYVRVCTLNAAGCSSWFDLDVHPTTPSFASRLIASILLIVAAFVLNLCY